MISVKITFQELIQTHDADTQTSNFYISSIYQFSAYMTKPLDKIKTCHKIVSKILGLPIINFVILSLS